MQPTLASASFPRRDAFAVPPRPRKPVDPDSKKPYRPPKIREQMEENARRAAARHLRAQEMRSRHQLGTPVPMWQAPKRMRLDLDDPEGEQELEERIDHSLWEDNWQEQPETQLPDLTLDEPLKPDEIPQDAPRLDIQQTWEADDLWNALVFPSQ